MAPTRSPQRLASWALFGLLTLTAIGFEAAYGGQAVRWISEPSRGWIANLGAERVVINRTLPEAEAAGLRVGDRIVRINGQTFESLPEAIRLLDLEIDRSNDYEVERGGRVLEIELLTLPMGLRNALLVYGPFVAAGLAFIAMGILVFLMKPHDGASWSFLLLALAAGVLMPNVLLGPTFRPPWLEGVFVPAYYLTAAALIQLSVFFPQRRSSVTRRWPLLVLLYGAALGLAAFELHTQGGDYRKGGPVYTLRMAVIVSALLVFLLSALETRLRGQSVAVRLQALVVLTGFLLTGFVPATDQLYTVVVGDRLISLAAIPLFFIVLPVVIGYAIVQHDLFEIDTIVRRTYGYLLSTAAIVALYGGVVSVLNLTVGPSEITQSPLFTVSFVLAVVFLGQPLHRRMQAVVDRAFYRQQYDYRATITQISEKMTRLLDPALVKRTLVDSVTDEMFLENGLLLLADGGGAALEVGAIAGADWPASRPRNVELAKAVMDALSERRVPVFRHEIDLDPAYEATRDSMRGSFDELGAELMLPMVLEGKTRGVLSLGRKKSGKMFTREDLDLLRTLINHSAVALENARLFEEVADHLKRIQMLENVKSNLAKFVPQTVQRMVDESPEGEDLFEKHEKDVTVVFADITGYTRLSSQLPLEEVNQLIERYFSAFMDEILKRGGDLNSTEGDGMMVIFQNEDPRAHARAAVQAALGILSRTEELNKQRAASMPLGVHIGVNSGIASLGAHKIEAAGGSYWAYSATGPTTNMAARLCGFGETLVISDETRARLDDAFLVEDLGPQTFKNVAEPVRVHLVKEELAPAAGDAARPEAAREVEQPGAGTETSGEDEQRPGRFTIRGVVTEAETGRALPALLIRAYDKDLVSDDHLGDARSDAAGRFEIHFTDEFFGGLLEENPDIYLRVFERTGSREIHSTMDSIRRSAGALEIFEVQIARAKLPAEDRTE